MKKYVDKDKLQEFAQKLTNKYKTLFSSPLVASLAADMTDTEKVYVYTGYETGYTSGHWYYYNGSAWEDGGVYNAVAVEFDDTLSVTGKAADAKAVGDALTAIEAEIPSIDNTLSVLDAAADAKKTGDELSSLNSEIAKIKDNIISSGGMFPSSYFSNGGINSSGNYVSNIQYRVCTPNVFTVKNDMIITADDGFLLNLWIYPSGASAYTLGGSGLVIPKDTSVRVMIRRIAEDTSELANIEEFSSALFLELYEFDVDKINSLSNDIICERYKNITYTDLLKDIPTHLDIRSSSGIFIDYNLAFHNNPLSIHFKTNKEATSTEIRFTIPSAITLAGTQEFEMCVYIDDATNITNISLRTLTGGFVKGNDVNIVSGWNKFRFYTEGAGSMTYDTDIVTFRIIVTHATGTDANLFIGSLVQVKPAYGNIVIIADGPYYSFYTEAYPTMKTNNIPVCWAVDATLLDDVSATERHLINNNELEVLATDGISEFSFHSYDLTLMSNATAAQALSDTLNSIRFLKKNGLQPEAVWRAAWLQNSCAHPELANLELEASCSYNGASGVTAMPPADKYNIPRISLQGRDTDYFDALFTKLKNHHCTVFFYTHGISTTGSGDMTPTMLNYFVSKIIDGVNEGYLNPTTYNRLMNYYKKID